MNTDKQYVVKKPEEFSEVIDELLRLNKETLVIALEGDLGAGKTAFTQELGKKLGVGEVITSPTFTIMKQYDLENTTYGSLVHIDAYRIESEEEMNPLHIEELMQKPKTVICVEWPDNIKNIIPSDAVRMSISIGEGDDRIVSLSKF